MVGGHCWSFLSISSIFFFLRPFLAQPPFLTSCQRAFVRLTKKPCGGVFDQTTVAVYLYSLTLFDFCFKTIGYCFLILVIACSVFTCPIFGSLDPRMVILSVALWARSSKNPDGSTGLLACPFACSLSLLTLSLAPPYSLRSRTPLHSLVCSLAYFAHSLACATVND